MARWKYVAEDLKSEYRWTGSTMKATKAEAKTRSMATGHTVVVVAVDMHSGLAIVQGAYYGRSWREGSHHHPKALRGGVLPSGW